MDRTDRDLAMCEPEKLKLSGQAPLFRGHQRFVFQHPEADDLLIKVMRADYVKDKFGPGSSFHNRHRRCREYQPFLREFREYFVVCARAPWCLPYIQEIVGLVWTDLGLGLIVRKVRGREGHTARTLEKVLRLGPLDAERQRKLDDCLAVLLESHLVIDDLNHCNLVLGIDASGQERFVLIDGIGSSTFLPLKTMFPALNRWSKRRRIAQLRAKLAGQA